MNRQRKSMRLVPQLAVACLLGGALPSVAAITQTPSLSRTEALVELCRVWATVELLDPQLMEREVDWDGALVRAIPKVREVRSRAELAREIGVMLTELGDPVTRVRRRGEREAAAAKPALLERRGDVLVVRLGPLADSVAEQTELAGVAEQIAQALAGAQRVVFDLRTRRTPTPGWVLEELSLVSAPVAVPPLRQVLHSGYSSQDGSSGGGFYSALQVVATPWLEPFGGASVPSRFVFVVGDEVPPRAAALWWSGAAALVAERPLSSTDISQTQEIDLGGGWAASIRVGEAAVDGLAADAVVVPAANGSGDDATLAKAIALARDSAPLPQRPAWRASAATPIWRKNAEYREMASPELPYRLLALFRFWSVIDRFYPYKSLIGDWDAVLREFIPRFESASDDKKYARAIFEMAARIEDGHTQVYGHGGATAVWDLIGVRQLPIEVRAIEGRYLVTAKLQGLPPEAPIVVGDEVVSIDGEPVTDAVRRRWKLFTASTEAARTTKVLELALRGPHDSTAVLEVRGADGQTRSVEIARVRGPLSAVKEGETWRVLDGNVGYVDLTRLMPEQVDVMFDALMGTQAIIFDMRGYPSLAVWPIASRLDRKRASVAAVFCRPQVMPHPVADWANTELCFEQVLAPTDKPKYRGRAVMLIDERAMSWAEQTGLLFEAANGTRFVGSNTAGADGTTTELVLPGGIHVVFTGEEVRHADGRQLQRIGLVPDVRVEPTVQGIRAGRDEVLERALALLRQ
jgi:C-terminal processing protease CtpA/Prc